MPLAVYCTQVGGVFLLAAAAAEFVLTLRIVRGFSHSEPMYLVWICLCVSAGARLAGGSLLKIVSMNASTPRGVAAMGGVLSGPVRMVFLILGLVLVLRVHHSLGLLGGLGENRRFLTLTGGVCLISGLAGWHRWIAPPGQARMLGGYGWLIGPLQVGLLVMSVPLLKAASRLRGGLLAKCWSSYGWGILLSAAAEIAGALERAAILPQALGLLLRLLPYPAAAAFALAPAYQLRAMRRASSGSFLSRAIGNG